LSSLSAALPQAAGRDGRSPRPQPDIQPSERHHASL